MTAHKLKAAELVAAGKLTSEQIGKETGFSRRAVEQWKADKEFQDEVRRIKNAWRVKARGDGLADRDFRFRGRNDRYKRMQSLIRQRAKDPQFAGVAGGDTGLLTVIYKMQSLGEGQGSKPIAEYAVDKPLMDAMLEIEEHQAIEKGQWKEKVEHSGSMDVNMLMARLRAGRQRNAEAKAARDAKSGLPAVPGERPPGA